uniref:transcriptional-regulating factor 1-like n=1 Tax=Doryrhamphus excisus TaxID=161450 RepID=UPI0025AE1BB5|nr:transcriptional-regulating factor 1-like [Doryrhamphus excisus]
MECHVTARVNTGNEFQAELPSRGSRTISPGKMLNSEELLWQPQRELEESRVLQDQVEKLLLMCSSSCLPGGGSNTELALHCLHSCKGNIVDTLEMLLQTHTSPTGDYHYSGSDFWSEREKSDFNMALNRCGKNFTCIHQMVKTKTVHQCVEFYYHNKKLRDKQRKEKEQEKQEEKSKELRYPCKQCGKTFFKIQSRNAHMKIHRQPQEDLTDKFITRHLSLPCTVNHTHILEAPSVSFPCTDTLLTLNLADISTSEYSYTGSPNSQVSAIADVGGSKQTEAPSSALAFDQSWASFDEFYYESSQEMAGDQTGDTKEPINWL